MRAKKNSSTKVLLITLCSPQITKLGHIRRGLTSEYIRELIDKDEEEIKQHLPQEEGGSYPVNNARRTVQKGFKIYPPQEAKLARVRKKGISLYIRELIDKDDKIIKDFLAEE